MSTARTKRPTESQPDWPQHLSRWQQSGLSQAAYCQTHDLVYHRFNYWRRKLAAQEKLAPQPSKFAVVRRAEPGDPGLSLSLPNGVTLRGLGPQHLAWLPQLLEQLS